MELTFNLEELLSQDMQSLDFLKAKEYLQNKQSWEKIFKKIDRELMLNSSIKITSRDIREFIDNTFGIDVLGIETSSNKNRLNEMIRKVAPTRRGQRTNLDYFQFRDLILLEDFNRFILKHYDESKVSDKEKLYREIMFLQMNKYNETRMYQKEKWTEAVTLGSTLAMIPSVSHQIKQYYLKYAEITSSFEKNRIEELDDTTRQIFDIIRIRFENRDGQRYYFSSYEDVFTTSEEKIVAYFIRDFTVWYEAKDC